MRTLFHRGFATLLIIAVAMASNLHLPLVQAVAWTRMYAQYREVYAPAAALTITLSGQYPCALCQVVQSAEKERDNLAGALNLSEQVLLLPWPSLAAIQVVRPAAISGQWREWVMAASAQMAPPETPPPRVS